MVRSSRGDRRHTGDSHEQVAPEEARDKDVTEEGLLRCCEAESLTEAYKQTYVSEYYIVSLCNMPSK